MKPIMLAVIAAVCLTGVGSFSFAEEMGQMKGEMKGGSMKAKKDDMKAQKDAMKSDTKAKKDDMKGEMKTSKDSMKGEMKGAMGK